MPRFLVLRVPTTGPPALIASPNDFATRAGAEARVAAIEARRRQTHHTWLDILEYEGAPAEALSRAGALS